LDRLVGADGRDGYGCGSREDDDSSGGAEWALPGVIELFNATVSSGMIRTAGHAPPKVVEAEKR